MRKRRIITGLFSSLVVVVAVLGVSPPIEGHAIGVNLEGFGTATVDGIFGLPEWASAGSADFLVNLPEGGTTLGSVFAMNDASNLYLAVRFARAIVDPGNSAAFEFDNDHSGGSRAEGDDVLLINPDTAFHDEFRTFLPPCPPGALCGLFDTDFGGTNDGAGAFFNDGAFTVYEFSHPLDSADDAHDFSLHAGDTVGFNLSIRMIDANNTIADTDFPFSACCPSLFGDIVIARHPVPEPSVLILLGMGCLINLGWALSKRLTESRR